MNKERKMGGIEEITELDEEERNEKKLPPAIVDEINKISISINTHKHQEPDTKYAKPIYKC